MLIYYILYTCYSISYIELRLINYCRIDLIPARYNYHPKYHLFFYIVVFRLIFLLSSIFSSFPDTLRYRDCSTLTICFTSFTNCQSHEHSSIILFFQKPVIT